MLWISLLLFAKGDQVKGKDFAEKGSFSVVPATSVDGVELELKPLRIPKVCVDSQAPKCVALELTVKNTGSSVVTVDLDRLTTTWWKDGAQHPLYPVTQTWEGADNGYAELVLPPGQSWSGPLTPGNPKMPTTIDVTEAQALHQIFQPGYSFQLSLPVVRDGQESWFSAAYTSVMP